MVDRTVTANERVEVPLPFPRGRRGHVEVVETTDSQRATSWEHRKRRRRRFRINAHGISSGGLAGRA